MEGVVSVEWSIGYWTMDTGGHQCNGVWTLDIGQWTADIGQQEVDTSGMECGQWTVMESIHIFTIGW